VASAESLNLAQLAGAGLFVMIGITGGSLVGNADADGNYLFPVGGKGSFYGAAPIAQPTGDVAQAALQRVSFSFNLADLANADLVTALTPGFAGTIIALDVFIHKPATTAAKLATLQAKINAVNTTGGAAALTSANSTPGGAKVAGSAITALNTFNKTDTIGVVISGVTAFVEGSGTCVLTLRNDELQTRVVNQLTAAFLNLIKGT
jgi:hypothetical protein